MQDITNELYVSNREKRIQQELVLGIGGLKALEVLGIKTSIYHLNEGHSAFTIIARLQDLMLNKKLSFPEARAVIKASTVFTTHTPVISGNENLGMDLVKKYLQPMLKQIAVDFEQIAKLAIADNNPNIFWLPALAINFSKHINGVSKQHSQIAQAMWAGIFPQKTLAEIPIHPITNGVHISWISEPFAELFNRYLGPEYIHCSTNTNVWEKIYTIPDAELWEEHRRNKRDLINFVKREFTQKKPLEGYAKAGKFTISRMLNTDYLTIVFARRFAAYKMPTLILQDKERLIKILTNPQKPVQLIFAGKAHPADEQCKNFIKEVIDFARESGLQDRVIFLEDYDINTSRHLCWGADVWLNNPARDMEASGTSGMKAAMNGVLQLSTLEGWWIEGYNGSNGWAVSSDNLYNDADPQHAVVADQLYDILENEITGLYYSRNDADTPELWVKMMKDSIYSTCRNFNINRVLCDYLRQCYIPAKKELGIISNNNYKLLKAASDTEKEVVKHWSKIKVASFTTTMDKKDHIIEGQTVDIECGIQFSDASPNLFVVELFYAYDTQNNYKILPMKLTRIHGDITYYNYTVPIEGYGPQSLKARIKPANPTVLDMHPELIKWND